MSPRTRDVFLSVTLVAVGCVLGVSIGADTSPETSAAFAVGAATVGSGFLFGVVAAFIYD